MGGRQSKHTQDEVSREKDRYLRMTIDDKKFLQPPGHFVTISEVKPWSRYYVENIPRAERRSNCAGRSVDQRLNQRVSIWRGDITYLSVDAIVNSAAKPEKGGQVNIAILSKAGEYYKDECILNGFKEPGKAMVTGGYRLPAKYIMNVLSPRLKEKNILQNCYVNSLDEAKSKGIRTLAFPCIATRKKEGFTKVAAASIALNSVRDWLEKYPDSMDRVIFCLFLMDDYSVYKRLMQEYFPVSCNSSSGQTVAGDGTASDSDSDTDNDDDDSADDDEGYSYIDQAMRKQTLNPEHWYVGGATASGGCESIHDWKDEITCHNPTSQDIEVSRVNSKDGDGTNLYKQLYRLYSRTGKLDLTATPYIYYEGEEGIDFGALKREFFYEAMETFTCTKIQGSPAFEGQTDYKLPCPSKVHMERNVFVVTGRALAHSVLHGGTGIQGLSRAVVYLLCHPIGREEVEGSDIPMTFDDMPDHTLKEILLVYDAKKLTQEQKTALVDYMANFNIGFLAVNNDNLPYIKQEIMLYEVVHRRWSQIEAIRRGMDSVGLYKFLCENPSPENIRVVFPTSDDLRVDPETLKRKIVSDDAVKTSNTWQYFVRFLDDLHQGKLGDLTLNTLLKFWIATPYLPADRLEVNIDSSIVLPESAACFSQLTIPGSHKTYKSFSSSFHTALEYGATGFGES